MKIKPVEDRLVRDPVTMLPIPAAGITVPDFDPHWREAVRWGDVEIVPEPDSHEPPKAALAPLAAVTAVAEAGASEPGPIEHAPDAQPAA